MALRMPGATRALQEEALQHPRCRSAPTESPCADPLIPRTTGESPPIPGPPAGHLVYVPAVPEPPAPLSSHPTTKGSAASSLIPVLLCSSLPCEQ